jgi:hypothetical protein
MTNLVRATWQTARAAGRFVVATVALEVLLLRLRVVRWLTP